MGYKRGNEKRERKGTKEKQTKTKKKQIPTGEETYKSIKTYRIGDETTT